MLGIAHVWPLSPRFGPVAASKRRVAVAATLLTAGASLPMLATSDNPTGVSARPATEVRPLSCEPLADVPGKSVTTARVFFPPDAYTPAHRHPGSVTAYVIAGSIRSQMAGTAAQVYAAGSTWLEPAGALHVFAENASRSDTAELLAVFIADHDCGPLVVPEPHDQGSR